MRHMRRVRVIEDVETLRLIAEPTRAAILELLTEPRSVSELADSLDVPRTRLYHHIHLLQEKGLIQQVDERSAGALTERVYALTAKTFRASARLLRSGSPEERADAITTLVLDTTKADVRRAVISGEAAFDGSDEGKPVGLGRSLAYLDDARAAAFLAELEALVTRFDAAHDEAEGRRPYALTYALYPSSRTAG